jgi:hypothetical protein
VSVHVQSPVPGDASYCASGDAIVLTKAGALVAVSLSPGRARCHGVLSADGLIAQGWQWSPERACPHHQIELDYRTRFLAVHPVGADLNVSPTPIWRGKGEKLEVTNMHGCPELRSAHGLLACFSNNGWQSAASDGDGVLIVMASSRVADGAVDLLAQASKSVSLYAPPAYPVSPPVVPIVAPGDRSRPSGLAA